MFVVGTTCKKLKKFECRNDDGFTIVELMVVIGILGILVSIVGPAYSRYHAKARQSEAKLALGAIFSLEKSFYSEYGAYVPSLDAIGYTPEGHKFFYGVGWTTTVAYSGSVTGYVGTTAVRATNRANTPDFGTNAGFESNCNNISSTAGKLPDVSSMNVVDAQSFTAGAAGPIRYAGICDIWQITEAKFLRNTQVGY